MTSSKAKPVKASPGSKTKVHLGGEADVEGLPPGLVGLLHQIPRGGAGWPAAQRDAFLAAFTAVLNFTIPVREHEPAPPNVSDNEEDET